MINKVSLVVITDGRQSCIEQTINRFNQTIEYPFFEKIIVDDSADLRYHTFLSNRFPEFTIISHETRRGLAGAVISAWASISKDSDYIFHLEDDFLIDRPLDINYMATILIQNPHLAQIALVRAPVNPPEEEVGGFVFQHLEDYSQKENFFEHDRLFTLNPSLYPMSTVAVGWPVGGGESEFTSKIHSFNKEYKFAFLGEIYSSPYVTHIGGQRSEGWFL